MPHPYVFVDSRLGDYFMTSWCGQLTSSKSFLTCLWTWLVVPLYIKLLW